MKNDANVLIFGAGAVGSTVGGWLAPHHKNVHFFDRTSIVGALRERGLCLYLQNRKDQAQKVAVTATDDLSTVPKPDIIVLTVKNYSLDAVAKVIVDKFGRDSIIVACQNGVENQTVLPKYFPRVVYGIVSYNAWLDEPGVVGYQKHGPLVVGSLLNLLRSEVALVSDVLSKGVETTITERLQDAAHSKMIVNLTNSFTTLIGHGFREVSDKSLFQKVLSNLTYEGVRIARAAGYQECQVGGMPSWALMTAAARLPSFVTRKPFEKNVKKMVVSSMAQDVIQRGSSDSELESINGYFIALADKHAVQIPYNRAIYDLCRENFKPGFEPLDVRDVWARVQALGG